MKKKPARKGRFFHALNVPRALCRTPRKRALGQDLGGAFPCERRERGLFGRIPGCSFRAAVARRRSFARKNSGSGARFLAAQVLPANAASLQAAAAGLMRAGRPCSVPGWGKSRRKERAGRALFSAGMPLLFTPRQQVSCARECPCFVPGWGRARRKDRAGHALFSAGTPLLFTPRQQVSYARGRPCFVPGCGKAPCKERA